MASSAGTETRPRLNPVIKCAIRELTFAPLPSTLLSMSTILLTNDDGISAPGLQALEKTFAPLGELWVIAPNIGRSACGRAVTLHHPLRVSQLGPRRFSVDGTPADCVLLGYRILMPSKPQLVISGINQGHNVGEDLDYSGTVGAAAEGALQGAQTSIAFSVDDQADPDHLAWAAQTAGLLARRLQEASLPPQCYLNVNFPKDKSSRIRWTRQGNFLGTGDIEVRRDPRGRNYYWIGSRPEENEPPADTDRGALESSCISVSLLTLDRSYSGPWSKPSLNLDGIRED